MSESEVSICNRALFKLGAESIQALNDNTNRARVMNMFYQKVRDAELRRRRWRFSIKRDSLAALATAPISDFQYQYQVPNDFLRLLEGGDIVQLADLSDFRTSSNQLYSLEGRAILTNLGSPLKIRYVARIDDPNTFDTAFAEALASRLAYEGCEKITQSDSKRQLAMADYKTAISEAIKANALELSSESIGDDSWVLARLG